MDFHEVLSSAANDGVDEVGLLILVTYNGVARVNAWIARTGNAALLE